MDRERIGKHKRTHAGSMWHKHRRGGFGAGQWLRCVLENLKRKRMARKREPMFETVAEALNARATCRRK